MTKEEMKEKAIAVIDKHRECYLTLGKTIYENPETGYREVKTTKLLADALETLGLKTDRNIAVTGCRSYANENKEVAESSGHGRVGFCCVSGTSGLR